MTLNDFNHLSQTVAEFELHRCCGSARWAQQVALARPFSSKEALFHVADQVWNALSPEDWLEAFSHHPKIGQSSLEAKFAKSQTWSTEEQRGVQGASDVILQELKELNILYENKFGFLFLVCATGKSAEEMLSILHARISNSPELELQIAAQEQAKITRIRLEKLLNS